MLNLTSLFLQQLKTGDLVITSLNVDVDNNCVTVQCKARTEPREQTEQADSSTQLRQLSKEDRKVVDNALQNMNRRPGPFDVVPLRVTPDLVAGPAPLLKPDIRTMITYAELCGSHENKWHAKKSLDRILRDERFTTPESVAQEWIRRCKPKTGEIPQEAKNLEAMLLMEDN